jgi:PKD repeat protein
MDKRFVAGIAFALATGGLLLYAERGFKKEGYLQVGYYVPVTVLFTINIRGGKPPYTVTMDYGDGTSETFTTSETTVTKTKTYSSPGNYVPNVTVVDAVKQTTSASAATLSAISPETIAKLSVSLTWTMQTQGSTFVIV